MGKKIWNRDTVRAGFKAFFQEFGRDPTFDEITMYPKLPHVRTLQRHFGGFEGISELFGVSIIDRRRGSFRSAISKDIGQRGLSYERALERLLVARFGEHFVHAQRPMRIRRKRADFHVYTSGYEFDVDIFYAQDVRSFAGNLVIKIRTLQNLTHDIYLICANETITDIDIANYITHRREPYDSKIKILTYMDFLNMVNTLPPLRVCDHMSRNDSANF